MIRRPPRSTQSRSSAASDVYKRQESEVAGPGVCCTPRHTTSQPSRVCQGLHDHKGCEHCLPVPRPALTVCASHWSAETPLFTQPREAPITNTRAHRGRLAMLCHAPAVHQRHKTTVDSLLQTAEVGKSGAAEGTLAASSAGARLSTCGKQGPRRPARGRCRA